MLATVLLCTFVPAVPLYVCGTLYRWRHQLCKKEQEGIPQGIRTRLFYFFGSYAPACYYWEGVVFAVRTAMVLLAALSSTYVEHGNLQMIVFGVTWVTLVHFLFVFKYRPYARNVENRINNVTQGALLALLLCALGLSLDDAKQESRAFATVLLTFCAALLLGTISVLVIAFVGQWRGKRAKKREDLSNSQAIGHGNAPVTARVADGEITLGLTTCANNPVQDSGQSIQMQTNPMHQVRELGETADELKARATLIYADKPL